MGFTPKEVTVMVAGRGLGKTRLTREYLQMLAKHQSFDIVEQYPVDSNQWFIVRCLGKEVANWVRDQPEDQWYEHIDDRGYIDLRVFDIHEELMAMMKLRWS